MSQSESNEAAKGDVSSLLLLVDIANIRPRLIRNKKRFLENFGMKLPLFSKSKYEHTSIAFIDQCLFDLARSAPGAVIVKYADFGLKSQLVGNGGEELLRRNSLDDFDPDKIFIVGTSKADNALLTASFEVGGSIISQDQFGDTEYQELKTESTRLFIHSYDEESEQFDFQTQDGLSLQAWWQETNSFVSGEWLASDEYLDVEVRLRNQVKQANWQWITTPLVHNPEIPAEVYERIEETSREKRRRAKKRYAHRPRKSSGRYQEIDVDQDVSEFDIYDPLLGSEAGELSGGTPQRSRRGSSKRSAHRPKKSSMRKREISIDQEVDHFEVNEPFVEFTFSEPKRSQTVSYLLADDFHGMRKNLGNSVTLVGRISLNEGRVYLQWIPGVEAVEIINHPNIDEAIGNAFVQLDGVLEVLDNSVVLRTSDDEMFTAVSYAHIREKLNAQARKSQVWPENETRIWAVPSFVDTVRNLWSLRQLLLPNQHEEEVPAGGYRTADHLTEADQIGTHTYVEDLTPSYTGSQDQGISDPTGDVQKSEEIPQRNEISNKKDSQQEEVHPAVDTNMTQVGHTQSESYLTKVSPSEDLENVEPVWPPLFTDGDSETDNVGHSVTGNENFFRRRTMVVGILLALLISVVLYLTFSSDGTQESNLRPVDSSQPSVAQWRYFESVVWRK